MSQFLDGLTYRNQPAPKIILVAGNPYSGGKRGAKIIARTKAEILAQSGWQIFDLDRTDPRMVIRKWRFNISLWDQLKTRSAQTAFFLETVKDPRLHIERVRQALQTIHASTGQWPLAHAIGGDGTIIGTKQGLLAAGGFSLFEHFARLQVPRDDSPVFTDIPILSAALAGTACDVPRILGAKKNEHFVRSMQDSAVIPMASIVGSLHTESGTRYTDLSHSLGSNISGEVFKRAEPHKYGLFEGTRIPYFMAGAELGASQVFSADSPIKPFYVHYSINGGEEVTLRTSEALMTGMRYLAGFLLNPGTPIDGLIFYFLPPELLGQLSVLAESAARGFYEKRMKLDGISDQVHDYLNTLPPERQVRLRPGSRIKVRYTVDEAGKIPTKLRSMANGEPIEDLHGAEVFVTPTCPVVARRESPAYKYSISQASLTSD